MSSENNICSVCQEEKYSYFRITEAAKLKAEKGGYYNLKVNDSICTKCYNEKIQFDRNEREKKKKDSNRQFKRRKSTETLITTNEEASSVETLKKKVLELNKEIESLRSSNNEKIIGEYYLLFSKKLI